MNLNKLDVMLCLAFQESDGPFSVLVTSNTHKYTIELTKVLIKELSDKDFIISIEIIDSVSDRRWRKRYSQSRRLSDNNKGI